MTDFPGPVALVAIKQEHHGHGIPALIDPDSGIVAARIASRLDPKRG